MGGRHILLTLVSLFVLLGGGSDTKEPQPHRPEGSPASPLTWERHETSLTVFGCEQGDIRNLNLNTMKIEVVRGTKPILSIPIGDSPPAICNFVLLDANRNNVPYSTSEVMSYNAAVEYYSDLLSRERNKRDGS